MSYPTFWLIMFILFVLATLKVTITNSKEKNKTTQKERELAINKDLN